ncbi:MAG TPA: sigma-70 family RNA polymerase sigma factor [Kofleriaceae bacterium]
MNVLDVCPAGAGELGPAGPPHTAFALGDDDRRFVYAVARRIVGCANDADDVTQDALLLAYRHRAAFRGEAKYRTWLYRIASTTALSFLRRRRRSREQLEDGGALDAFVADDVRSPEAEVADLDTRRFVRRAIAELEPRYRDVVLWRISADETEAETAARLGISVANVKVRAFRARAQLRDTLAPIR